jgi:Reverse transcriptase (RNA-dependent DNA polymerase)
MITDDFSRYRKTVPLKHKDEAEKAIQEFIAEIKAKGHRIEAIRKDGGTEFGSKKFDKWLKGKGIQIENSAPYTPEQNRLSERSVGLVYEKARLMLLATDLPQSLWAEAVLTATYLMNRSPTRALERGLTPYEAFYCTKPSILHIRVFGCTAYSKIPKQKIHGKLMPRSKKMRLVGYESSNIYRLWDGEERSITLARDVVFNEAELAETAISHPAEAFPEEESESLSEMAREALKLVDLDSIDEEAPIAASMRSVDTHSNLPNSYSQAKRSPAAEQWQAAIEKQMEALTTNSTWELVDLNSLPSGAKILSGKWVYVEKEQENGEKIQKARWVVRGFEQTDDDVNWDDLRAVTVRAQTTRILFAMAAENRWEVQQMDAVAAFLNGEIKDDVFVEMPMGWRQRGKVCKLKKTLYGLRSSPAIWYRLQASFLKSIGFEQSEQDPALFSKRGPQGVVFISSHVDDYLITGSDTQGIRDLKAAMAGRFKMKDMGHCVSYLGMEIKREGEKIYLCQAKYTTQLLKDTGMWDVKTKATPMESGEELQPVEIEKAVRQEDFRRLVGKIQWLAVMTRPDITYAVSRLASVANRPSEGAWTAIKRLLRYLRGTVEMGLTYGGSEPLRGYSDANWAEGESGKATTGIVFTMNGGPIHWYSRRQNIVALSTCEAEYIAASTATQDAAWIGPHVQELVGKSGEKEKEKSKEKPVLIMVDNQGAITLAKKDGWNRRTRHMNVRYQYVQQALREGKIKMEYVASGEQLADGLTKALKTELFERWRGKLGEK